MTASGKVWSSYHTLVNQRRFTQNTYVRVESFTWHQKAEANPKRPWALNQARQFYSTPLTDHSITFLSIWLPRAYREYPVNQINSCVSPILIIWLQSHSSHSFLHGHRELPAPPTAEYVRFDNRDNISATLSFSSPILPIKPLKVCLHKCSLTDGLSYSPAWLRDFIETNKQSFSITALFVRNFFACKGSTGTDLTPHNFQVTSTKKVATRVSAVPVLSSTTRVRMGYPPSSGTWRPFHLPETPRVWLS